MGLSLIDLFCGSFGALDGTCRNYQRWDGALADVAGRARPVGDDPAVHRRQRGGEAPSRRDDLITDNRKLAIIFQRLLPVRGLLR